MGGCHVLDPSVPAAPHLAHSIFGIWGSLSRCLSMAGQGCVSGVGSQPAGAPGWAGLGGDGSWSSQPPSAGLSRSSLRAEPHSAPPHIAPPP